MGLQPISELFTTEVEPKCVGSEFQTTGAATWKFRWPNCRVLVRGTSRTEVCLTNLTKENLASATIVKVDFNANLDLLVFFSIL